MKKFEERLSRLEEISGRIRESGVPVEQAMEMFEEGIKLAKGLEKDIDKMEGKISILLNQPLTENEKPELDLFTAQD